MWAVDEFHPRAVGADQPGLAFRPLTIRGRAGRVDLSFVRNHKGKRAALVFLAKEVETAQRFLDMYLIIVDLLACVEELGEFLTEEERRIVSVACKNVTCQYRAAWRAVKAETSVESAYKNHIREELLAHCRGVLTLFTKHRCPTGRGGLAPRDGAAAGDEPTLGDESKAFIQKMIADYHRYIAEVTPEGDKQQKQQMVDHYRQGMNLAQALEATHPIRLGLALNYSVSLYEICNDAANASQVAKDAFDGAIAQLDHIEENFYKDSTLIMQLLRDNLTQWSTNNQ